MGQKIYESDKFLKTGGTSSQYLMADGTTSTGPTGGVDVGTGTANKVPKFSDSDTITDGIMTDDGTSVLVGGNLAIGIGDNDNLFHIEATDNTYDVSRAMEIDYTKSHTTTGWGASVFGARVNVYADGVGQQADVQGGSFSATHNGSGISYYLLGSQSNANHSGSGNTGAIWGAYNRGKVTGSGTGTHPFLIGTNQVAELNNANASVGRMQSIVAYSKTTSGDITGRLVGAEIGLDCNQGSATAANAAVLYLASAMDNITVSGTSRSIDSVSTLPSVFAGTIQSTQFNIASEDDYLSNNVSGQVELYGDQGVLLQSGDGVTITIDEQITIASGNLVSDSNITGAAIIKSGGTSSQFLKADGSVDTNTYLTGTLPTDFVSAASGGTFSGDIIADSFAIPGGSSSRFLKADGSTDANTYVTGAGTSGNIAIFDTTNGLIDNSDFSFNFITSKVTMGADLDVTGDIATTNVTADAYHNQQVILTSNFSHASNNALSYYSMPFNSLGESISVGEQHFFTSPGSYRLRTIIMRNTSTGATLTATTNNFRVVKNGTTLWTGASNFFGSGQGAYSANALNDSDATWALGDMIQFQFTTNGDWKDVAATMVLELI